MLGSAVLLYLQIQLLLSKLDLASGGPNHFQNGLDDDLRLVEDDVVSTSFCHDEPAACGKRGDFLLKSPPGAFVLVAYFLTESWRNGVRIQLAVTNDGQW